MPSQGAVKEFARYIFLPYTRYTDIRHELVLEKGAKAVSTNPTQAMILTIPCGGTVTIPANTSVPVVVTSGGGGVSTAGGEATSTGEATPTGEATSTGRGTQARPPRRPPRPEMRPLAVEIVTPQVEIEATTGIEEAVREVLGGVGVDQLPPGSAVVIGAEAGWLGAEEFLGLTKSVEGLYSAQPDINVEVHTFEAD